MRCHCILDVLLDSIFTHRVLVSHYVRSRQFVAAAIRRRDTNHSCVEDLVVGYEMCFKLGGRYLQTFVLDEFLAELVPTYTR